MAGRIRGTVAGVVCLVAIGVCVAGLSAETKPQTKQAGIAATAEGYVGSAACSRCHQGIANEFAKTSMGRSLTRITPEFLKTLPVPATYYDAKTGHHFDVHAENGKLYQTEHEAAAARQDVFRNTHELEWIIGTGENGFGALLRRGDSLFQAPLSYYSKAGRWGLSPGYENDNLSFNRIILPGCIYCHSGRPVPVANHAGAYASTPFTQTAVGCENCHGPGAAHMLAMHNSSTAKRPDATIVNPGRIAGRLADDICMSCHQTGDTRVLQPGKTYQDFRPGTPLDRTVSIFAIQPTRENPPQDDHVEHLYSMTLSKCYRATIGLPAERQMHCITCHDPHVEPTHEEAPKFYNAKCLSCHTAQSCTAPIATRKATLTATTPADNCIGCHMPKRDIRVISHSTATNHRITARPDEPFPDEAFSQTSAAMPDLIHLDPAAGDAAVPSALTRLQAYADLAKKKPEYAASWLRMVNEQEGANPENPIVQAALGHRDLEAHKLPAAIAHLQHALQLDPAQTEAYVDLSEAYDQSGQAEEAIVAARKAVTLDPFVAALQKTLAFRLINGKHYDEAQGAMEAYLEKFPEDDFMRKMLAMAKAN
jgi:tetratricopeptide repeat protein